MQKEHRDHLFYNSNSTTFENAQVLRLSQTKSEEILWNALRNRKFNCLKFRRQHPLGPYIADFYCHQIKLAIEVDGLVHERADQKLYDEARTNYLNEIGIQVIRFTNDEVSNNLANVLLKLQIVCSSLTPKL